MSGSPSVAQAHHTSDVPSSEARGVAKYAGFRGRRRHDAARTRLVRATVYLLPDKLALIQQNCADSNRRISISSRRRSTTTCASPPSSRSGSSLHSARASRRGILRIRHCGSLMSDPAGPPALQIHRTGGSFAALGAFRNALVRKSRCCSVLLRARPR